MFSHCPARATVETCVRQRQRRRTLRVRRLAIEMLEDRRLLSGVTMITHGHWGTAAAGGWVDNMAAAIARQALAAGFDDVARYRMVVEKDPGGAIVARPPVRTSGPADWEEAIFQVDWSTLSVGIFSSTPTGAVADAIADYLLSHTVDGRWLVESPIHLVGHSRGASLQSALAGRLGEVGIWVDQLTMLDPHPVDGFGGDDFMNFGDAPMRVWQNVRFADDYWRDDYDPTDFDGELVPGAFSIYLDESVLGEAGYSQEHSDVHLWYHGTVDTIGPVDDGEIGVPITDADGWYNGSMGPRDRQGFYYSRIEGGTRPAAGLASAGAARVPLSLTVGGLDVWDNVEINGLLGDWSSTAGESIDFSVFFEDLNRDAIVGVGFDNDANPYNGTLSANQLWQTTLPYAGTIPFSLDTAGLAAGAYRLWALITNEEHVRYDYAPGTLLLGEPPPAEVVDRHVFYNQSTFDGGDAAADLRDDLAVAPDKQALLPGQIATAANYTSYARGINGVMIDVAGLRDAGAVTAADFLFKVGRDDEPAAWETAPPPREIDVRPGAGTDGSDRMAIVWDDHAIENEWLQVTLKADQHTGLTADDVFYFGNAIGEAGNAAGKTIVNATDEILARNFQHGALTPAAIDDPYDYNRDGLVNGTDQIIAREHQTNPLTMLRLIAAPPVEVKAAAADSDLFEPALAGLNWLYELRQMNHRTAKRTRPAEAAVDKLLATYW